MKWLVAYLTFFGLVLSVLAFRNEIDIAEPLFILLLAGGGFTLVAHLVTRRQEPLQGVRMRAPWWSLLAYLFLLAGVLALGFPQGAWLKLGFKLLLFVVLPIALFRLRLPLRFNRNDTFIAILMFLVLSLFQLAFGGGPRRIAEAGLEHVPLAILASLVWMTLEAGLTEEITFRAVMQTRLEEITHSRAGGIVLGALLFGFVHVPGLYLRTSGTGESFTDPSLLFALGYSIVVISPIALFFGYLWVRTRNILLLAFLHGAGDAIPKAVEVANTLGLSR
jgi:uncharacterized protein